MSLPTGADTPAPAVEWSGVESTDSDGRAAAPRGTEPTDEGAPKPPTTRSRPPWWARPELLAVAGLLLLLAELVVFGLFGWLVWLVANIALVSLLLVVSLACRGKLGELFRRRSAGKGRPGGAGGGRRPGLFGHGRAAGRGAGPGSSTGVGGAGRRRSGLLGGLANAGRRAAGTGKRVRGAPAGRSRGGGDGGRSPSGNPHGRRGSPKKPSGSNVGRSDGAGPRKIRPLNSFLRGLKEGAAKGTGTNGAAGPSGKSAPEKKKPNDDGRGKNKPGGDKPSGDKPNTQEPDGPQKTAGKSDAKDEENAKGREKEVPEIEYSADQSLQRWGRNLAGLEEYGEEVARLYQQAEQAAETYRAAATQIRDQAETELPASPMLKAEVEAVTARAQRATNADDWKAVAADAGTLPGRYRQEHETDEDRLNSPRTSQQAEMRADVTSAVQDN